MGYPFLVPFTVGMVLGVVHFAGLWVTLQRLPDLRRPFPVLIGSFLARTTLVLAGFFLVLSKGFGELAAALAGFIMIREILRRRLGGNPSKP